ncbi:MAG: hypothetical protein JOY61_10000 [Chloroflexi bacterium]|nr:hypothetical protein [Chloroflexota bacterium]
MRQDTLRNGDIVEVKSPGEILATLDAQGATDGLPFMREMMQYSGRRFVVSKRAQKICDTVHWTGSRRVPEAVMLEDLRCDGSAHGGCQAECRLFWKESWLRRVEPDAPSQPGEDPSSGRELARLSNENATRGSDIGAKVGIRYRCQATELHDASERLRTFDPRPYLREYTCGNVPFMRFLRISARALAQEALRKLRLRSNLPLRGTRSKSTRDRALHIQPGEVVRVKSREEIAATLTPDSKTRGLWFDHEMLPFCGGTYRVRRRVSRIIDERSGEMIELKSDCLTLENVVCSGEHSTARWFCPREIYPYWREAWLERVTPEQEKGSDAPLPEPVTANR